MAWIQTTNLKQDGTPATRRIRIPDLSESVWFTTNRYAEVTESVATLLDNNFEAIIRVQEPAEPGTYYGPDDITDQQDMVVMFPRDDTYADDLDVNTLTVGGDGPMQGFATGALDENGEFLVQGTPNPLDQDLDAGGHDITNAGAVDKDHIEHVADVIIRSADDAHTKLAGAAAGSVVYIEPGTTHSISNPEIAELVTIYGNGATLEKGADGPICTVNNSVKFYNLTFNGNQSTYTGDGVVDGFNNIRYCEFYRCVITGVAGSARTHNGARRHRYYSTSISNSGTAIHHVAIGDSGQTGDPVYPRRSQYDALTIQGCDIGFHYDNVSTFDENLRVRFMDTDVPFYIEGGHVNKIELHEAVTQATGPSILVNNGQISSWSFSSVNMDGLNDPLNATLPIALTDPIGDIHIESATGECRADFFGGVHGVGDGDVWVANHSAAQDFVFTANGGNFRFSNIHPPDDSIIGSIQGRRWTDNFPVEDLAPKEADHDFSARVRRTGSVTLAADASASESTFIRDPTTEVQAWVMPQDTTQDMDVDVTPWWEGANERWMIRFENNLSAQVSFDFYVRHVF